MFFLTDIVLFTGADSLAYLSVDGLVQAVRHKIANKESPAIGHCTACLTGDYPEKLQW
jgi:amidophosphoribosyltransferase